MMAKDRVNKLFRQDQLLAVANLRVQELESELRESKARDEARLAMPRPESLTWRCGHNFEGPGIHQSHGDARCPACAYVELLELAAPFALFASALANRPQAEPVMGIGHQSLSAGAFQMLAEEWHRALDAEAQANA